MGRRDQSLYADSPPPPSLLTFGWEVPDHGRQRRAKEILLDLVEGEKMGFHPMCLYSKYSLFFSFRRTQYKEAVHQSSLVTSVVRRLFSGEVLSDNGCDVMLTDDLVVESSVSSIESPGGADQPDFMTSGDNTITAVSTDVSSTGKHRHGS